MTPYNSWTYLHITEPSELLKAFEQDKPRAVGFDTETTGLHIIADKPFLIQLGWKPKVFTFEPTEELMRAFFKICRSVQWVFGHNVTYDCHMLANIGYGAEVEKMNNLCDTQAVMRLSLEAKSTRDGGDNLKLKDLGVKYIHPYAANSEAKVKQGLKDANDDRVKVLTAALKQFPMEGHFTGTGRQKFWGKGAIEDFMKVITNELTDLPDNIREIWKDWQEEYPEPNYSHIDRALMIQYAGEDVATTLMLAEWGMQVVQNREQMEILQLERDCLLPTYRMERRGLRVDLDYLEQSRIRMRNFIIEKRKELMELVGETVTVNQHARIGQIFDEKWNITMESTDKRTMLRVIQHFEGEPKRFAELINTLRTAEKWYSTYILAVQKNASYDGRAYTQINLNGAVSGRMSSNFQQFPRGAFKAEDGTELYHPRQAFVPDGGYHDELLFEDLSQIELRVQAHYTLLVSGGDLNLCRAYMPFQCRHNETGEVFEYKTDEGRSRWNEQDDEGLSVWRTETGEPWTPTDLHSMTASKAYPNQEITSDLRSKGKTTNFACNYGAGWQAISDALNTDKKEAERLVNGYKEAYPHVVIYQKAIEKAHAKKGYVTNHYGRRYYLNDNRDAYKLANYVVQGTAADALKRALIKIDKFLMDKETKLVLPVHDELIFTYHMFDMGIEEEIRQIFIDEFDWCLVPVNAGIEMTKTNWREAA